MERRGEGYRLIVFRSIGLRCVIGVAAEDTWRINATSRHHHRRFRWPRRRVVPNPTLSAGRSEGAAVLAGRRMRVGEFSRLEAVNFVVD